MNKNSINKQTYTKMNKKNLFVLGFSAALLAGCSSDNVAPNGGDGDLSGDAYVSISLHLPTTTGTRGDNDDYDNGDANEYKVNSLAVLYFDSSDKFIQAQTVNGDALTWSNVPTTPNGITTDAELPVQKVSKDVAKVLVLINPSTSNINVASITAGNFNTINSVIDKLHSDAIEFTGAGKDNFFMSNSPLSDGTVLVNVTPSLTVDLAKANKKNVYVERAVAKVTLNGEGAIGTTANWKYTIPRDNNGTATSHEGDVVEFQGWALDVVNRKEYPIRKTRDEWINDDNYTIRIPNKGKVQRFKAASIYTLDGNNGDAYRTYWAEDPNYTDGATYDKGFVKKDGVSLENFTYINSSDVNNAMTAVAYCPENTFDVTNMKQGETTRVVFKAKYTPKSNLVEGTTSIDGTWYMVGTASTAYTKKDLEKIVLDAINAANPTDKATKVTLKSLKGGKLDAASFTDELFTVEHTTNATAQNLTADELNIVKATLPSIVTYEDGYCYYVARIQHFGNELTPWSPDVDYTVDNDDNRYNYLGRYGVVRNNWYQMTLNTVSGPGTPDIPEIPDEKDDEANYYLQTTVKIMDWAVRKQKLDF